MYQKKNETGAERRGMTAKRGRKPVRTPKIVVSFSGLAIVRKALGEERGDKGPAIDTIRKALSGETDNADLVKAVARRYPSLVTRKIARRYGLKAGGEV